MPSLTTFRNFRQRTETSPLPFSVWEDRNHSASPRIGRLLPWRLSSTAPVYGFYAGNDARVGATIPKTQEMMRAAKKTYDVVTYEGAGHGFMRAGEAPDASAENKKARDEAWVRWKKLLKTMK